MDDDTQELRRALCRWRVPLERKAIMPNMGYCRWQNTLADLEDCNAHLWDDDLSDEEEAARKALIRLCARMAEDGGDADDDEEDEDD